MRLAVSRVRTKKSKTREKQAERATAQRTPLSRKPAIGLAIGAASWALTVLLVGGRNLLRPEARAAALPLAADAAFLLAGLFATALLLQVTRPNALRQNSRLLLLALISLAAVLAAKIVLIIMRAAAVFESEAAAFMLPMAMAPLLGTILVDGAAGAALGLWTALAMTTLADYDLTLFLAGITAAVVAARLACRVRTRSRVVRIGIIAGLSEIFCVLGLTALNWREPNVMRVLHQATACLLSGFLSALMVLLILPLFETLFRITSDITLLELSDLSHAVLQRLAIEAPGTYHHSLVVANLAQAAAEEIGANSLLARVASYFHDIGKLTKPGFFTENIPMQPNPHDDLPPSMSSLVITSHVKEGLSLAMLHKLPDVVQDVIREHHGTSLLSWFHRKAIARQDDVQGGGSSRVAEDDFRYPGPRPSSRESAIICLADSVEAASRSMEKSTPAHIEHLVSSIVNRRLIDGQLDESDLTLAELAKVKRSFVFTLANMFHGRVPYPQDENLDQQGRERRPAERGENRETGAASDAARRTAESPQALG